MISISLAEYYSNLKSSGVPAIYGVGDYLWIKHESFSAIRFPEFITSKPSEIEIKRVFSELNCLIVSFCTISDVGQSTNTILYNCYDKNYSQNKLSKNVVRDIRIGQKNLTIEFVQWNEILVNGFQAFHDTRTRVGLSDGTKSNFEIRFKNFALNSGHKALATKFNNEIVAFMSLIVIEDYVIIQGSFSTDEHRKFCPNNTLADFVLNYFLKEGQCNVVSYGLSSIQEDSGSEGLHNYKVRVGFQPINVDRSFVLHSYISPVKKQIGLLLSILLKILPKNRKLKKAQGIFNKIR